MNTAFTTALTTALAIIATVAIPGSAMAQGTPAHSTKQLPTLKRTPVTVIHTGPDTIPAAPFYQKLQAKENALRAAARAPSDLTALATLARHGPLRTPITGQAAFPITSATLTVGAPSIKRIAQLPQPIFVIGMDPVSLRWLNQHFAKLKSIGATGMVVHAPDYRQFAQLRANAQQLGMTLTALPGDDLARVVGMNTYPTLLIGPHHDQ